MLEKPTTGWCVDGSTRGNPGPSEYRCVCLETNRIIFHVKLGVSTNNICEFIALGHAILEAVKQRKAIDIYTDSITAMSWILKRKINSSLTKNKFTEKAIDYSNRILSEIKNHDISGDTTAIQINNHIGGGITVYKWFTSEWGEISADFGNK